MINQPFYIIQCTRRRHIALFGALRYLWLAFSHYYLLNCERFKRGSTVSEICMFEWVWLLGYIFAPEKTELCSKKTEYFCCCWYFFDIFIIFFLWFLTNVFIIIFLNTQLYLSLVSSSYHFSITEFILWEKKLSQ